MGIRDLRNRARADLHRAMSIPAIYVAPDGSAQSPCTIRVHARTKAFGDMTGFDYTPAERIEIVPEIVTLADEVIPGGMFSVAEDEAYTVEVVMPRDGITVTSQVTRMSATEISAAGLPVPPMV